MKPGVAYNIITSSPGGAAINKYIMKKSILSQVACQPLRGWLPTLLTLLILLSSSCQARTSASPAQAQDAPKADTTASAAKPTPTAKKDTITFAFTGDIMLGTTFPEGGAYLPANEGKNLFDACKDILQRVDVAAGNCEGTIATGGTAKKCGNPALCYAFRQPPYMAKRFAEAGFDVLNLANNHSNDFGETGIQQTIKNLTDEGISVMGLAKEAPTTIIERDGLKIGFAGFAPSRKALDINDYALLTKTVKDLKSKCDIVIVSMHGGAEGASCTTVPKKTEMFHGENRGDVYKFAHTAIDAGADVVWGHGPHVPRPMEVYKDRLIMYSLGNFCTPYRVNVSGVSGQAPLVEATLNADGSLKDYKIHSFVQQKGAGPRLDSTNAAASILRKNP